MSKQIIKANKAASKAAFGARVGGEYGTKWSGTQFVLTTAAKRGANRANRRAGKSLANDCG